MKLTDILFLKVIDESGETLGHVLDLRCQLKSRTNEADVREFIYGYGGLAERLGLKKITRERISWEAIVRIANGTLILRDRKSKR